MGDSGESLIDADSRIQERQDELARERAERRAQDTRDPAQLQVLQSLKLARTELERQLATTTHERRKAGIQQAIAELDRRIAAVKP